MDRNDLCSISKKGLLTRQFLIRKIKIVNTMMIKMGKFRNHGQALWFLAAISLVVYACGNTKEEQQTGEQPFTVKGDTITLTENSNLHTRLHSSTIEEQPFKEEWMTTGIVKTIPNNYAEIAPPFAGRVLRSFIKLGQKVTAGTPLFEISSSDFFSAQKDYFDAQQEFHQAELRLKRQKDLLKHGVGIQRELEEAETEYEIKKTGLLNANSALKIFHVDPAKLQLGKPLIVYSPIAGEIISNSIVMGQYLKEDTEPIAIVAELSKVWIAAQVKEKDIPHLGKMDEVSVQIAAIPGRSVIGKIYHIGELVNDETRSVEVLVACDNIDRIFRPGMYANLRFKDAPHPRILVPAKSVLQQENTQFVFVKIDKNRYEKRAVQTAGSSDGQVIISEGLAHGETIVDEGGVLFLR